MALFLKDVEYDYDSLHFQTNAVAILSISYRVYRDFQILLANTDNHHRYFNITLTLEK